MFKFIKIKWPAGFKILCQFNLIALLLIGTSFAGKNDYVRGAKIWKNTCNRCHGYRDPLDFNNQRWVVITNHMRIRAGLSAEQTKYVLNFLTRKEGPAVVTVDDFYKGLSKVKPSLEKGLEVYEDTCIACHGENGKGEIPEAPNFTSKSGPLKQKDNVLMKHIWEGFQGPSSAMAMPAKGGNDELEKEDLVHVLHYMRKTFGSKK